MLSRVPLAALLMTLALPVHADMFARSPNCRKPYKPMQFDSRAELDDFEADVQRFQRCIERFVQEQEAAIAQHREAANAAIADWNRFVRMELN
jgi:hypothetical protein